jgi:hypothetical protein
LGVPAPDANHSTGRREPSPPTYQQESKRRFAAILDLQCEKLVGSGAAEINVPLAKVRFAPGPDVPAKLFLARLFAVKC